MADEQERIKLACPDCGAPLPKEALTSAVTCAQCGTTSTPAPRHEVVRETVRTVVVERVVAPAGTVAEGASGPPCPRCRAPLFAGVAHSVTLEGCGACGGIFLDNAASARITRVHDDDIARLAARADARAIVHAIDREPADLPCPRCAVAMKRVRAAFIDVDVCEGHGTWFDAGELVRVMEAFTRDASRDERERAAAEARLAALRQEHHMQIAEAESRAEAGGVIAGLGVGLLGVLGALVAGGNRG